MGGQTRIWIEAGLDPRYERKKAAGIPPFSDAAAKVFASHSKTWRNAKHNWQWLRSLEMFVFPKLGERRVSEITGPMVHDVLSLRCVGTELLFFGNRPRHPMSDMTLVEVLRDMGEPYTAHGLRSAFRDWASETTDVPDRVVEAALAHAVKDKTEAACRRGPLIEKRRELMAAWSELCMVRPDTSK